MRYPDRFLATLAAIGLAMEEGIVTMPYQSECGCFHLTGHKNGKDRKGKVIRKIEPFAAPDLQ